MADEKRTCSLRKIRNADELKKLNLEDELLLVHKNDFIDGENYISYARYASSDDFWLFVLEYTTLTDQFEVIRLNMKDPAKLISFLKGLEGSRYAYKNRTGFPVVREINTEMCKLYKVEYKDTPNK
ncbi:hypothetical protein J4209_06630 [Candidatus Woesearchaeota archaeon]|nr:hypothetical protein [Candidatus Woesearchaeota archaeon]